MVQASCNNNNPSLEDVLPTPFDMDLYEKTGYFGSRNWKAKYVDTVPMSFPRSRTKYMPTFLNGGVSDQDHTHLISSTGPAMPQRSPSSSAEYKGLFNIPDVGNRKWSKSSSKRHDGLPVEFCPDGESELWRPEPHVPASSHQMAPMVKRPR